jgi:UDP-N-acetyl-2-amino-2-deoxyglucuronate dehydrogenase
VSVRGVGVVGTGLIYERHARACADNPERVRLVAVADVDPERLAAAQAAWDVPAGCADHRELIARDDVDIVVVSTPPCTHEQIVVDALEAGKYVLCEKPLASTLAAADRIVDVAERHPGRLSVVHQFRYLPEVQRTLSLRDSGRLGELLVGRFSRVAKFKERRAWWGAWDVAGGGAVMTQLIHELDLMCHIFGTPVEVVAMADTLRMEITSEDTCAAMVRFANGAIVSVTGTMVGHKGTHAFDVIGRDGSAHSPWTFHDLDKAAAAEVSAAAVREHPDAGKDAEIHAHTPYMTAVLDAIDAGAPLPVSAHEACAAVELCAAIYASALTGAPVALPMGPGDPYYEGVTAEDWAQRGMELAR